MILDQFQRYQELVSALGQEPDEAVRTKVSNLHQGLQRAALSPQQMALVLQLEGQWQRRNGALEEAGGCWLDSLACAFTVRVAFDWLELVLLERVKTTDPELQRVVAGLRQAGADSGSSVGGNWRLHVCHCKNNDGICSIVWCLAVLWIPIALSGSCNHRQVVELLLVLPRSVAVRAGSGWH